MSQRKSVRYLVACAALAATTIVSLPHPAGADDNWTTIHEHDRTHSYYISTTLPTDWRTAVRAADATWESDQRLRLGFAYQGTTSSLNYDSDTFSLVWAGSIPSDWHDGCPPASTLACARWWFLPDGHITDVDFVYNTAEYVFSTSDVLCNSNLSWDVETLALHEFGHWGVLNHTDDIFAVMYQSYTVCKRDLWQHDIDSMERQYAFHS